MNTETKSDVQWYLSRTFIGLGIAFLIVAAGTSIKNPWLVIPVTTVLTAIGGYFAGKGTKTKKAIVAAGWGAIGLVTSVLWYIFS